LYDIISVGCATVDVFIETASKKIRIMKKTHEHDVCYPIGSKILIDKLIHATGGGGTNTGVAFSRLGLATGWIGKLGSDLHSRHLKQELKKEDLDLISKSGKGELGYSVILIGLEKDRTILTYKGINNCLTMKDIKLKECIADWFYLTSMLGSSYKTQEKLARAAKKRGSRIVFNPSSYLAKQGIKKLNGIIKHCHVLILNYEEANLILGKKREKMDTLLKKLQKKVTIIVITQGKKGAQVYNGIFKYRMYTGAQKIVETTGAGDAFGAGFIAGLVRGKGIEESLRWGYGEATAVIAHIGAKDKLLKMRELQKMVKKQKIKITKVKL